MLLLQNNEKSASEGCSVSVLLEGMSSDAPGKLQLTLRIETNPPKPPSEP
jgi:hypothetical protein